MLLIKSEVKESINWSGDWQKLHVDLEPSNKGMISGKLKNSNLFTDIIKDSYKFRHLILMCFSLEDLNLPVICEISWCENTGINLLQQHQTQTAGRTNTGTRPQIPRQAGSGRLLTARISNQRSEPLPPPPSVVKWTPLTVPRLRSPAVAADVFDLFADLAVEYERRVVVVVGGGLMLMLMLRLGLGLFAGAAAGLHPGQAESCYPLPRLLLFFARRSRRARGVGPRSGSGPWTHHVASPDRHVCAGLQGWTLSPSAPVKGISNGLQRWPQQTSPPYWKHSSGLYLQNKSPSPNSCNLEEICLFMLSFVFVAKTPLFICTAEKLWDVVSWVIYLFLPNSIRLV